MIRKNTAASDKLIKAVHGSYFCMLHRIAIRSYGTPVVIGLASYCVGLTRCVSFCACALLDTSSAHAQNHSSVTGKEYEPTQLRLK